MQWGKYIMDNQFKIVKILFFGAGKRGKYWIDYCKVYGMVPTGIIDNNPVLGGSTYEGIRVYNPDSLQRLSYEYIFITCNREEEIYEQLIELGVGSDQIVVGRHSFSNHMLRYVSLHSLNSVAATVGISNKRKVIFDLQNGMVLGGVESWSYSLAKELKASGYQGIYLATNGKGPGVIDKTYPANIVNFDDYPHEKDRLRFYTEKILENLPCTVIANFAREIFWAACIVKREYPELLRIVAIQHSDESLFYESYGLWKDSIDKCMAISSRIGQKLLLSGIEKEKLCYLNWEVDCEEKLSRTWNEERTPLQIGYAGRVTITSKRSDLLLEIALKLKEKDILFCLNIAGVGDYSETLYQRIQDEKLCDCINIVGYLERNKIPDFWKKQDIMISCSEWEGHSISQSEAMASGAVPVITDVSGARDDVTDGYNGYVVPVGDIDAIVKRIHDLYYDRDKLRMLGSNAYDTIYNRQKNMRQADFWKDVLKMVWQ